MAGVPLPFNDAENGGRNALLRMTADYNFQMLRAPLELLRVATVGASPLHGRLRQ